MEEADGANGSGQERNAYGQFLPGSSGGPGRPSRETEQEYLQALQQEIPIEVWRGICRRAAADALLGDSKARDWCSKYLAPVAQMFELSANVRLRDDRAVVAALLENEPDAIQHALRVLELRATGIGPS